MTAVSSNQPMLPEATAQIGDRVSFRAADVFLPEPREVLSRLTTDVEINGVIVEFSDSGHNQRAYALVRVTDQHSVLLPVEALYVQNKHS